MSFTVTGDYSEQIECAVCLESWYDPVELRPCEHLFCRKCIASCWKCPRCRAEIVGKAEPSPILKHMAARVAVRCDLCEWTGKRGEQHKHIAVCPKLAGKVLMGTTTAGGGATSSAAGRSRRPPSLITPEEAEHADPARPWRTYLMTKAEYGRVVQAFNAVAGSSGSSDQRRVVTSAEAVAQVIEQSELFGPGDASKVAPRDAAIFFDSADVNRRGAVTAHLLFEFLGMNRPARPRRARRQQEAGAAPPAVATTTTAPLSSVDAAGGDGAATATAGDGQGGSDDDDEYEYDDEIDFAFGHVPEVAAAVAPPPTVGGLPDIGSLGVAPGGADGGTSRWADTSLPPTLAAPPPPAVGSFALSHHITGA